MTRGTRLLITISLCAALMIFLRTHYQIQINSTGSLPNFAFLVKLGTIPTKVGEYVAFYPPANPYYGRKSFVKIIGGVGGDIVTHKDRVFYVSGREIGRAKEVGLKGERLEMGPLGVIPEGQYFMYGKHKDSYDSRYLAMGWIPRSDIIGTAIPIL